VTKVETRPGNPALANMTTQTEYSGYADHGEILTDIKSPGHIVQRQGGRVTLDIQVKTWETNNPYLVFPVPPHAQAAATSRGALCTKKSRHRSIGRLPQHPRTQVEAKQSDKRNAQQRKNRSSLDHAADANVSACEDHGARRCTDGKRKVHVGGN